MIDVEFDPAFDKSVTTIMRYRGVDGRATVADAGLASKT
jgi:hypothetical protein